jgi:uncharacterized Ntn-hydrolase superfamily protein
MTYSIVARDPATGELGVALQSRSFAAGRFVPWIKAGAGAVASQAFADPSHGPEALRLLGSQLAPAEVLDRLLRDDPGASMRQIAILDTHGRVAVHTGSRCVAAAGHAIGENCCAQGNMMERATVWPAMVAAFENASGNLAERLLAALFAAEREGGDLRGAQAAAIRVTAGSSPAAAAADASVDLRVDDHVDPVNEIKRLLAYLRAHRRAIQGTERALAGDLAGGLADLDACCSEFPREPEFASRQALFRLALGNASGAREALRRANDVHQGWGELLQRLADAGVIPLTRAMLKPLVDDLPARELPSGRP